MIWKCVGCSALEGLLYDAIDMMLLIAKFLATNNVEEHL